MVRKLWSRTLSADPWGKPGKCPCGGGRGDAMVPDPRLGHCVESVSELLSEVGPELEWRSWLVSVSSTCDRGVWYGLSRPVSVWSSYLVLMGP